METSIRAPEDARARTAGPYTQQELDEMDNAALLALYKETGCDAARWTLVLRYTGLLRRVATQTCGLFQGFAQMDDVIQEGILVLLNAVDKFDPQKGVKFETYIAKRLRGMVVDLARKQDWIPRQVRQKSARLSRASEELSLQLGHTPSDRELAEYLGLDRETYEAILAETAASNLISFEALLDSYGSGAGRAPLPSQAENQPEEEYQQKELHARLADGIAALRPNEQMVLSLYYEKELTMKEIAQVLGVSAPRVSQIHSRAIRQLQEFMKQYMET